jgi:outer membrane protein TolC
MRRVLAAAGLALLIFPAGRACALTLAEGLAIVDRSGRDVAISLAEEQVAASAPVQAATAWRPSVDLYARETVLAEQPGAIFGTTEVPTAEKDFFAYGVRVRQQLYDFGRTGAAVRATSLDTETTRLETALVRNRTALRFILAYVRLLRSERLLSVQQDEVKRFEVHRDDTRALLEEGTITENDLLEAEVRLSDAVQKRLHAENQRALVAARVNSMLLRPMGDPVSPEEIAAVGPGVEPPLEEALAAAARGRVELKQLVTRISAVEARRAAVRTEYYPQLFVSGGYEFTQNEYQVHEGNWALGAGVEMNIYSGGLTSEKLHQKELELQVLERMRERILDTVMLEVEDAYLSLGTARARVAATERRPGLTLARLARARP